MSDFINSNIETIDQVIEFIEQLSDVEYQYVAMPYIESSIGQHLRHVIDIYVSVLNSIENKKVDIVDYNNRRRGADVETQQAIGLIELKQLRSRLQNNQDWQLESEIKVLTEISLQSHSNQVFQSNLARELCFASTHLTHHLALMAVIAKLNGKKVCSSVGVAPSTATYTREKKTEALQ